MNIKDLRPLSAGEEPNPELFKLMAQSVQDYAIFLLDPSGKVATWNTGARFIKQYEEDEVIGKHFSIFYNEEDKRRGWPAHELEVAMAEGRFEDEGWRVRKDGSQFWANVVITSLTDETGTVLAFSKITRDLTDRKREEESLRQSEERFRLLVEGVEDYAIYMLNPNGIVTSWNAGALRIKGYESEEIIGHHFSRFYLPDDIKAGKPDAELAMARAHGRAEEEGWRVRKNGARFWARVVVTALYDRKGELRGFAKVTQDLTQQKNAEAIEHARQNIHAFIAVLAHELRNPLAPIRSAVHLMMADRAGNPHAKIIEILDRQSSQLVRIVDDILDVSRLTRGIFTITKKQIATTDLITRAVEAAAPGISSSGHTLIVNTDEAPLHIEGDLARLAQALTNVLNNACRYTPNGGTIRVTVFTTVEADQSQCVISIKDTGRGIDPSIIDSIFGLFIQDAAARKISGAGLGVGLALAKNIVELHHGTVTAQSEGINKGSEFLIKLPLSGSTEKGPAKAQGLDKQILVVDDNEDAAFMLSSFLSSWGEDVKISYNGEDALKIFESHAPRLVMLDIGMPGMDGLELARRIRALPFGSLTYIVAITGWGKVEDELRSRDAGIDLHLMKPVEPGQLSDVLKTVQLRHHKD